MFFINIILKEKMETSNFRNKPTKGTLYKTRVLRIQCYKRFSKIIGSFSVQPTTHAMIQIEGNFFSTFKGICRGEKNPY